MIKKKTKKEALLKDVSAAIEGDDMKIGAYLFKGYRVQVSKYRQDGKARANLLYRKRRSEGLCVVCGAKVTRKNPRTKRLYRLCEKHRQLIDRKVN